MFTTFIVALIFVTSTFKMNDVVVLATDEHLDEVPLHPCQFDLEEICGIQTIPKSQSEIYNARLCLGSNLNVISNVCYDYVHYETPSFVEACSMDIQKRCNHAGASVADVQSCLSQHNSLIHVECQDAMRPLKGEAILLSWPSHESVKDHLPELNDKSLIKLISNKLSTKFYSNFLDNYVTTTEAKSQKDEEQTSNNLRGAISAIRGSQEMLLHFSKKQT